MRAGRILSPGVGVGLSLKRSEEKAEYRQVWRWVGLMV